NEKCLDALGLLEEAANMRGALAKNNQDRVKWQDQVSEARQKLAASETRIASLSEAPLRTVSAPVNNSPAVTAKSSSPNHTSTTAKKAESALDKPATGPTPPATVPVSQANTSSEAPKVSALKDGKPMEIGSLIDMATQRVNPSYPQTAKSAHVT